MSDYNDETQDTEDENTMPEIEEDDGPELNTLDDSDTL